jgi:hypothetical protein
LIHNVDGTYRRIFIIMAILAIAVGIVPTVAYGLDAGLPWLLTSAAIMVGLTLARLAETAERHRQRHSAEHIDSTKRRGRRWIGHVDAAPELDQQDVFRP